MVRCFLLGPAVLVNETPNQVTNLYLNFLVGVARGLEDVWLAEKDNEGISRFTPLTDYRIRSRDDIERVYREGRVGGAPVIGELAIALGE